MKNILFVCTGNTCRSPMALGFFKAALVEASSLSDTYTASSAGISAIAGEPASINSIMALLEDWEIDISRHRAKSITAEDIHNSHLVLTMTTGHRDTLLAYFPEKSENILTLKEYAYSHIDSLDITDPYGNSTEIYQKCAFEIKQAIDRVIFRLKSI